ncbi:MAG: ABC transporter substrate-binding protein [Nocardioides sp.]
MKSRRQTGLLAGLGAITLALVAACTGTNNAPSSSSSQTGPTGAALTGGTVSVAQLPAVVTNWIFPVMDLAYFSVYNVNNLQYPMYRPLYWFGGHNNQPTLDAGLSVANPAQYSSDGKSITISLKPWKWSNGESVNADDVIFWQNMITAEKANWAAYTPGAYPDNVTKTTKVNDTTVKFTLDKKYSELWFTYNELSQVTPMPMAWDVTSAGAAPGSGGCHTDMSKCKAVYNFLISQAKDQKSYATSKIWGVVDGPWRLGSYSASGNYSLVPNPKYSGSPKPKLDEVKFLPFTTDSAEFNVLKAGGTIDIGYIPSQDLPQKPASQDVPSTNPVGSSSYLLPQYTWSVDYFAPNFNNPRLGPAFKQLYVRQALQLTLDQPVDAQKARKGYAYPNYSPVPVKPNNQWLSPAALKGTPYPFDPAKAKSLLTGHGWTMQGGVMTCTSPGTGASQCGQGVPKGLKLSIAYHYASGDAALNQEMQQYKSDAAQAGIQLNMKQEPFNSVIGEAVPCKTNQPQCSWEINNWGGGWLYAPDFLPTGEALFATGSGSNSGNYSDPKMDQLIAATQTENGTQPLFAYEDYTAQQLPVIFQVNGYRIWSISNKVGGVILNPLETMLPEYWYKTK